MRFTKTSGLVMVWAGLVMNGTYPLDSVPNIYNLKEVVASVVNETE